MKAAIYDGKTVSIKEVQKPKITDTQALIKVKAAGICGTDLAIAHGYLPTPTPIILGHEFTGEVVEIGKKVDPKWLNKRITSEINSNIDFDCAYCKRKEYTQCVSRKALGIDIDGGFAEYIALESYLLHELPDGISYDQGTFIEPLAAAYQTFEMMPIGKDDKNIAIFGLGKLGLLIVQVAKIKGLEIIVIDGSEKKLQLAKNYGADHLINRLKNKDIPKKIRKLTGELGVDISVDTSGNPEAVKVVVASCRTKGKLHMKSTHGLATPINLTDIVVRELTMYSSRCGPFDKAIEGLKSGKIQVDAMLTKIFSLDEIQEALDSYGKNRDHIKTILHME
jgi:threonine dehydrogenase-like Zn-dependent dehydrogenase